MSLYLLGGDGDMPKPQDTHMMDTTMTTATNTDTHAAANAAAAAPVPVPILPPMPMTIDSAPSSATAPLVDSSGIRVLPVSLARSSHNLGAAGGLTTGALTSASPGIGAWESPPVTPVPSRTASRCTPPPSGGSAASHSSAATAPAGLGVGAGVSGLSQSMPPPSSLTSFSSPALRRTSSLSHVPGHSSGHSAFAMSPRRLHSLQTPSGMHLSISSLDSLPSPAPSSARGSVAASSPSRRGTGAASSASASGLGGLMSSPSLVPRHDYIPSGLHSLRSRLPPAASPPGLTARSLSVGAAASPISKPIFASLAAAASSTAPAAALPSSAAPAPLPADASTVASSVLRSTHALIPIQTPASFVPPSPTPLASPFKSILRRHSMTTPNATASTTAMTTTPAATAAGQGKAHVPVRLFQTAEATTIATSPGSATATPPAAASPPDGSSSDGVPAGATHTRRDSLRPLAVRSSVAATENAQFLAELAEMHRSAQQLECKQLSPEPQGNGHTTNGTPSPSRAKRPRLEASAMAAPAPAAAASADSVGLGSLLTTPPSSGRHTRRSSLLLSSAAASPCHSRQGSASYPAPGQSSSSSGKARVRFDRAVILEFGLVPDASKVPGGDGDFSVGMTRRPHSGFVASLDAYERMRAAQRKVDGPDAIDEEVRRQVWLEAQREAERLSREQRSRSGIKLASRHASQHAQGRKRKRDADGADGADDADADADSASDADEYSDDSYYSDEYEEDEEEEDEEEMASDTSISAGGKHDGTVAVSPSAAATSPSSVDSPNNSVPSSPQRTLRSHSHSPSSSQPPSPSSACFRLVPADPHASAAHARVSSAAAAAASLQSDTLALPPGASSPIQGAAPSPSPPPALLFSDAADLATIRASRRTAGCDCRGSRKIKVCGAPAAMASEALARSKAAAVQATASAGLRGASRRQAASSASGSSPDSSAAAAAASSPDAPVCPCFAAGVGCNSNICRCFSYCCVNHYPRYAFNQTKVNSLRRKILSAIQSKS